MKTQIVVLLALIGLQTTHQAKLPKSKRGSLLGDYSLAYSNDLGLSQSGWKVNTGDFNLNVDLPPPKRLPQPSVAVLQQPSYGLTPTFKIPSNKPIIESQEYIPPQSSGTAILPQMPVPAIPVNAIASNIPASRGAVFLGSGSIGVVDLGNGAYALGSGSIGYSENRSRPRPTSQVPVYPPIRASPDLIPAAVPTPQPPQPAPPLGFVPGGFDFGHPLLVPQPSVNQNGYEFLPPNRVAFGTPNPPRPIRTRMQFATPTALQLQPQQLPNNIQYSLPLDHSALGGIPLLA